MDMELFGVSIPILIFGIVEAAKDFGVTGTRSKFLALLTGIILVGITIAIEEVLIAESAIPYIKVALISVSGSLATMGYYDFLKGRTTQTTRGR